MADLTPISMWATLSGLSGIKKEEDVKVEWSCIENISREFEWGVGVDMIKRYHIET